MKAVLLGTTAGGGYRCQSLQLTANTDPVRPLSPKVDLILETEMTPEIVPAMAMRRIGG
ncbi:hypothetical protein Lesp02_77060 [Lentzea sp. NBRC 105346]|uniref:hypothetical protein n=1 Tax=Lentzea sp. NBRC 105346 TaxID=3032205 RepID=UPI0024A08664|nr:hypothetical protein [Lentzea sp. NBRC 105346]GLZ35519.1 hypothetical protein Lesp02_77060 [Lentzea sp. NBRC 105346]